MKRSLLPAAALLCLALSVLPAGASAAVPAACSAQAEAERTAGFSLCVPETLFSRYERRGFCAVPSRTITASYRSPAGAPIRIAKTRGPAALPGPYPTVRTFPVDGTDTVFAGFGESVYAVQWEKDGFTYTVHLGRPSDVQVMARLIRRVR